MKTKTYVKGVAALCALAAVACTGVQQSRGDVAVYLDESQPLEKRVEDALSRMTLEEKVGLLHAQSKFSSAGVPRLGIPEVVQLYIGDKLSSQPRPVKELKGFERVFLKSGESRDVKFVITEDDLKFYNSELHYVYEPGEFDVMVGPNSRDVQTKSFQAK